MMQQAQQSSADIVFKSVVSETSVVKVEKENTLLRQQKIIEKGSDAFNILLKIANFDKT